MRRRERGRLFRRIARRFERDDRGASAVEFALIAPFLLLTILFLMSVGYIELIAETLDRATSQAARALRVGSVQSASTPITQTTFRTNILCPLLPSLFNCNNVIVNIQTVSRVDLNYPKEYYNYVNSNTSGLIVPPLNNAQTNYAPGTAQCVLYVQVLYPVSIFMSFLSSAATTVTYNGQQVFVVMSTATFLTEPYTATPGNC